MSDLVKSLEAQLNRSLNRAGSSFTMSESAIYIIYTSKNHAVDFNILL